MSKIKYIIFDLAEVLLTGIAETGTTLSKKYNIQSDTKEPGLEYAWFVTPLITPLLKEFFHGNISEDEYIRDLIKRYPEFGTEESLKQHIRGNFREVKGTRKIVLELKNLGYTLALLSVHAKEWIDYCEEKFDFHKMFDLRVYSYEAKVSKPDPLAFKNVLDQLKALPEECLFIDDSYKNIDSAKKLGFQAILFTDSDNLREELKKYLPDF